MTLSQADKVLLAISEPDTPRSAEDVIVAAWSKFPETFSLNGHSLPDSHKVLCKIMGTHGLVARSLIAKTGKKYQITMNGKAHIAGIKVESVVVKPITKVKAPKRNRNPNARKLEPALDRLLVRLFSCPAVSLWEENREDEIGFNKALEFLGLKATMKREEIDLSLHILDVGLHDTLPELIGKPAVLSNGREISSEDVLPLIDLRDYMLKEFSRHIAQIRKA